MNQEHEEVETNVENDFTLEQEVEDQKNWQECTGLNPDTLMAAMETLIFMSEKPITAKKIRSLIDRHVPMTLVQDSITKMKEKYAHPHHGIALQEVAEGYQFRTKQDYAPFVLKLFNTTSLHLTPATLEVLAIVAYKQPISKSEIEKMRGVDSSHLIRTLLDKKLLEIRGRSDEELGRPTVYGTSKEFLEVFNLRDLQDLPPEYEMQSLIAQTDQEDSQDLKDIVKRGAKNKFFFDEIEELDQLKQTIKSIATDTDFTLSLKEQEEKKKGSTEEVKTAFEILENFVEVKVENNIETDSLPEEL